MVAIAKPESGYNTNADNSASFPQYRCKGLWQICQHAWPDLHKKYNLFDPRQNAAAAYEVFSRQAPSRKLTTGKWSTYPAGAIKYYGDALKAVSGATGDTSGIPSGGDSVNAVQAGLDLNPFDGVTDWLEGKALQIGVIALGTTLLVLGLGGLLLSEGLAGIVKAVVTKSPAGAAKTATTTAVKTAKAATKTAVSV
jgi:hypothetical protein